MSQSMTIVADIFFFDKCGNTLLVYENQDRTHRLEKGQHFVCGGEVTRKPSSPSHDVYCCNRCPAHFYVPRPLLLPADVKRHLGSRCNIDQNPSDVAKEELKRQGIRKFTSE